MTLQPWPPEFFEKKRGHGCPQCEEGRVEQNAHGVRFLEAESSDAYLQFSGPTPGYSVLVFRGRHVSEPQSMTPDEHRSFWTDISRAARAIETVFAPVHLNFQLLGNADPHVHVHIVPRYDPDPAPSMPLPQSVWAQGESIPPDRFTSHVEQLRAAISL